MNACIKYYRSSIGKKTVVAVTGLFLVLFVVGHLLGNLQIFLGQYTLNNYAAKLHGLGPGLWVIRLGLLAVLLTHMGTAILLVIQNRQARPERYAVTAHRASTVASRTMALSGILIFVFIIVHLLHYTAQVIHPNFEVPLGLDPNGFPDVYSMMILSFRVPWVSGFYVLAMLLLCFHLSHGLASMLQTLGLRSDKLAKPLALGSRIVAILLFLGYVSIPLSVAAGILTLP